jgi:hypothetical protein
VKLEAVTDRVFVATQTHLIGAVTAVHMGTNSRKGVLSVHRPVVTLSAIATQFRSQHGLKSIDSAFPGGSAATGPSAASERSHVSEEPRTCGGSRYLDFVFSVNYSFPSCCLNQKCYRRRCQYFE